MATADDLLQQYRSKVAAKKGEAVPTDGDSKKLAARSGIGNALQDNIMQMLTFGFSDNLTSALTAGIKAPFSDQSFGEIYNENQAFEQQVLEKNRKEHPIASTTGAVTGALIGPDPMAKMKVGKSLLGMLGTEAARGAVNSAAQAFGEADEGGMIERLSAATKSFFTGGLFGAAAGTAGRAITKGMERKATNRLQKAVMTLKDETDAAYKKAFDTGEVIPGAMFTKHMDKAVFEIRNKAGYRGKQNKKVEALITDFKKGKTFDTPYETKYVDIDLPTLDKMRQDAWFMYNKVKTTGEKAELVSIVKALDNTFDEAAEAGSPLLKAARNQSRMKRNTEMFDQVMKEAGWQAKSGSGDFAGAYRNAARKILTSPKTQPFLNAEETAALESIIDGTGGGNIERFIGRFAPTSGSLASLVSMVTLYHNPALGVGAMAAAHAARKLGAESTMSQVEGARRLMSGSPVAEGIVGPTAMLSSAAGQIAGPPTSSLLDPIIPKTKEAMTGAESLLDDILMRKLSQ